MVPRLFVSKGFFRFIPLASEFSGSHSFSIAASNNNGIGASSSVVIDISGEPGPVENVQISSGDGKVSLTWELPADDGGSPIISYRIYKYMHQAIFLKIRVLIVDA